MRKLFLLIPALALTLLANATAPTITIDGDKSDWAEVPMLTEPGTWPMLKVLPAADANLGTNALVYMMEHTEDFDPTWAKYPTMYVDKDYDLSTAPVTSSTNWQYTAMGVDYKATTGAQVGDDWVSFPKAMSSNNKVFEIGVPATYITDLGSKFGFAMYYNSGAWYCPDRSEPAIQAFSPKNGFLYKTRSFTTVAGTTNLTTASVYAHPSMGEVGEYVDFGLRDNGYDTLRWAAFPIELTQPAVYDVTVNISSTNDWKFEFWLVDVATNAVVAHLDRKGGNSADVSKKLGTLDLTAIPAGKYMLKVMNKTAYSKVKLNSIDLTYAGGAAVNVPGTLNFDDVILSSEAWVAKNVVADSIFFTAHGAEGHNSINYAKWKVNVTTAGAYNFTANVYRKSGHQEYEIKVLSNDENEEFASNALANIQSGSSYISTGVVYLEPGIYTVKVRNTYNHADGALLGVVAEYIGGAVQAMPGTTDIDEAWFVGGTRANGKITFTNGHVDEGWTKWNVSFASAATYKVKLTVNSGNGRNFSVALLDANDDNVVTPLSLYGDGGGSPVTLEMGEMTVPAGNYILKVSNSEAWSDAEVISVTFVYEGGAVVTVPAEELVGSEAVLVDAGHLKVYKMTNGDLHYNDNGHQLDEYVYWNINATKAGNMKVTANVVFDQARADANKEQSGHKFHIELYSDLNNPAISSTIESSQSNATGEVVLPTNITIPAAGNYIVKLINEAQYSSAILHSLEFEYLGGDLITLPATLNPADALFSEKAYADGGEIYFSPDASSQNVLGQWAKWNVKVATAGTFLFTLNVTSTLSQTYKITILDGETEVDSYEKHPSSGAQTIKHYFDLPVGNYTVKVENTYTWSDGHVVSLVVAEPSSLVAIDEMAETNAAFDAYDHDNLPYDVQLIRTIVAGMYNTICLPFDVSDATLKAVFGSDVELKEMSSAELNGNELDLIFADVTTGIYRGTPYLIMTSSDVVNPIFTDVLFKAKVATQTTGTNADFIGSFIKGEVPAGENNLFLGPENLLYFSQTATPIKGMRAWFQVKGVPNAMQAIKRANIVTSGQVITSVDFVKDANNGTLKTIENGQVIIIRDGVRYNVMGVKIQ